MSNIDGANVTNPDMNTFDANGLVPYANDAAFEADQNPFEGAIYWNTTEKCVRQFNGAYPSPGVWQYDKTTMITATDSTSTGADQSITPGVAQMIRFTSNTLTSINNIVPTLQKMIYLANDQSTQSITIKYDTGGTAANRIRTGNNLDYVLKVNQIAGFIYDNINARWRLIEKSLTTSLEAFASDALYSAAHAGLVAGDGYWNTVDLVARIYDGTGWQNNKVLFSTEVQSIPTGAAVDITPVRDQIIKVSNASLTSIRGVIPTLQKFLVLVNGTGATISILNEDLTATAANRIVTGTALDLSLTNDASILLAYDTNSSRWRVTGGSGSGTSTDTNPINYITSPSTAIGWTRTGTTGAAGNAPATTTTAADLPLGPTIPTAIKILSAANAGAENAAYVSFPFTTPAAGGVLTQVSLFMKPGSNFIANEWTVSVYQGSTRQTLRTDSSGFTFLPNFTGQFPLTFEPLASTAYTIRIARTVNAGLNVGQLNIAQVYVGPGIINQTSQVGKWTASTFTSDTTTNATTTSYIQQISDTMKARVLTTYTGASNAGTGCNLTMPSGLTINTTVFPVGTVVGNARYSDDSASQFINGTIVVASTTALRVRYMDDAAAGVNDVNTTASTPYTIAANDFWTFTFDIPINEWVGQGLNIGAGAQEEYVSSTTGTWDAAAAAGNTVYGPAGSPISGALTAQRAKVCRLAYPLQATDRLVIQYQLPSTGAWLDTSESNYTFLSFPAVSYGAWISSATIGSTDVTLQFSRYASPGATYNTAAGSIDWANATYANWRLVRYRSSSPVGFGPAGTDGSSGLVAPYSAAGILAGGTYTPVLSNNVNCTSALSGVPMYSRTGPVVTVSGTINIDATVGAPTTTSVDMTIPITSAFTGSQDAAGIFADGEVGTTVGSVKAVSGGSLVRLIFRATSISNNEMKFTFQYVIK